MPILNTKIASDAGVYWEGLPDSAGIPTLFGAANGNLTGVPAAFPQWEALTTLENGILQSQSAKATLAVFGINVGFAQHDLYVQAISALISPIEDLLRDAINHVGELAMEAIMAIMVDVFEAIGNTTIALAESIPVYGYFVEIIWKLAMAIRTFLQLAKEVPEQAKEYKFPFYVASLDRGMFNMGLARMRQSVDWTWLWRPPTLQSSWNGKYFGLVDLEGQDNWLFRGLESNDGAPGLVPGTGWLHQSIIFSGLGPAQDTGPTVYPTMMQQNSYLWKTLNRNDSTAAVWCVDAARLKKEWAQYLATMWAALRDPFLEPGHGKLFNLVGPGGPFAGMNLAQEPTDKRIENMAIMQRLEILHKRQWALTNSPTVAYADADMAAFQSDPVLRSQMFDRRQDLLEHGARCSVDLDMVRDTVYLQALQESGVDTPGCGPTALAIEQAPFVVGGGAPKEDPGLGLVIPPPPPPAPTVPPPTWLEQYGPWVAGAAAVAVAGFLGYRHVSRQPNGLYLPPVR